MARMSAGVRFSTGRALGLACATAIFIVPAARAQAQAQAENPPVPSICKLGAGATAATCQFTASAAGLPVFARTEFPDEFDVTNHDPLNTAEHELFHAIGFTVSYAKFAAKLIPTPGAGAAPWPATGYDQSNDIMQPNQVIGNRLNALDAVILDDAFGWGASGIQINIINVGGTLDATDLQFLTDAVGAVNAFYRVKKGSPVFTWAVAEVRLVPEPAMWMTMVIGFGFVGGAIRRHARIAAAA